jgi:hypothetical protein
LGLKKKHPAIGAGGGGAPTPGSEVAHSHGAVAILGSKGSSKVFFIQRQNGRSWHHRNINGSGFSSTVAESQWKIVQPCLIFEGQFKEKKTWKNPLPNLYKGHRSTNLYQAAGTFQGSQRWISQPYHPSRQPRRDFFSINS